MLPHMYSFGRNFNLWVGNTSVKILSSKEHCGYVHSQQVIYGRQGPICQCKSYFVLFQGRMSLFHFLWVLHQNHLHSLVRKSGNTIQSCWFSQQFPMWIMQLEQSYKSKHPVLIYKDFLMSCLMCSVASDRWRQKSSRFWEREKWGRIPSSLLRCSLGVTASLSRFHKRGAIPECSKLGCDYRNSTALTVMTWPHYFWEGVLLGSLDLPWEFVPFLQL